MLAGIFWLLMTLNEVYEQEVKIVVRYTNMPQNAVLTSDDTDTLRVSISDKGFNILSFVYGTVHKPVTIDFQHFAGTKGTGTVGSSELKKMVVKELPASAKLVAVKPERLTFYYNYGEKKRVPVKWTGKVVPQQLYFIASTNCQPDSVTIYASKQKLDSINAVYTQELDYTDLHDTLTVKARLQPMTGVKIVPEWVSVTFTTDVLTEVVIEGVPIKGINLPPGKVLRTFPAKVNVKFVTGMRNYQQLTAADFKVVADYEEFIEEPSTKCTIRLTSQPVGISNAKLEVSQVDYLIEELTP